MKDIVKVERRLDWELTKKCNLNCIHCISRTYHPKIDSELSSKEAKKIVERCKEAGIDSIHFFGGEPTVREVFIDLLLLCDSFNISTSFTTNGINIDESLTACMSSLKSLINVYFSFEAIDSRDQDRIRGTGTFNKACLGLRTLAKETPDIPISISFTLNKPAMLKYSPGEIIDFFADLGAKEIVFQNLAVPHDPSTVLNDLNYGAETWFSFISSLFDPQFKPPIPFFYELKPLVAHYLNRIVGSKLPLIYYGCNALSTTFRLLPNGVLIPCTAIIGWPEKLERYLETSPTLVEKSLIDILELKLNREFAAKKQKEEDPFMEPCRSCGFAFTLCNPCVMGRFARDTRSVQTCKMIKELKNGS